VVAKREEKTHSSNGDVRKENSRTEEESRE
jgi:hypothetical protein